MKHSGDIKFSSFYRSNHLINDYLNGKEDLKEFYSYKPELKAIPEVISHKRESYSQRKRICDHLRSEYARLSISGSSLKSIAKLENEHTFTITTAHQPCLLTGPLYVIHKIVSTIKACEIAAKEFSGHGFIPVFWLGGEDHDLDEMNHLNLFRDKVIWDTAQKGAVGRFNLEGINKVIDQIKNILGDQKSDLELLEMFNSALSKTETYNDFNLVLIHELFKETGLVIVNADAKELKNAFKQTLQAEFTQENASSILRQSLSALSNEYQVQAFVREINLFYMKGDVRERIERYDADYTIVNTDLQFTQPELIDELNDHPERFSPNVILRPLYQEFLLPNIAFVGGGGEISYWLQLKSLFDHHKINFPMLLVRDSFLILPQRNIEQWLELGFELEDLVNGEQDLIKSFVERNKDEQISLNDEYSVMAQLFKKIEAKATAVDGSLEGSVRAEHQKAKQSLALIESKIEKAIKLKFDQQLKRVSAIHNKCYPNGVLQERFENFITYYTRSEGALIQSLLEHANVFDKKVKILSI